MILVPFTNRPATLAELLAGQSSTPLIVTWGAAHEPEPACLSRDRATANRVIAALTDAKLEIQPSNYGRVLRELLDRTVEDSPTWLIDSLLGLSAAYPDGVQPTSVTYTRERLGVWSETLSAQSNAESICFAPDGTAWDVESGRQVDARTYA